MRFVAIVNFHEDIDWTDVNMEKFVESWGRAIIEGTPDVSSLIVIPAEDGYFFQAVEVTQDTETEGGEIIEFPKMRRKREV